MFKTNVVGTNFI